MEKRELKMCLSDRTGVDRIHSAENQEELRKLYQSHIESDTLSRSVSHDACR